MIQVIRRGAGTWEVTRVRNLPSAPSGESVSEYEVVGRVVLEGPSYYAEVAEWRDAGGPLWRRQPRGYALVAGALAALLARSTASLKS